MKIQGKKYVIATERYPILFIDECGNKVDEFDNAKLYESEGTAKDRLSYFDDDSIDDLCVVGVDVTYNF